MEMGSNVALVSHGGLDGQMVWESVSTKVSDTITVFCNPAHILRISR